MALSRLFINARFVPTAVVPFEVRSPQQTDEIVEVLCRFWSTDPDLAAFTEAFDRPQTQDRP